MQCRISSDSLAGLFDITAWFALLATALVAALAPSLFKRRHDATLAA